MASYIAKTGSDQGDLRSDSKIGIGADPQYNLDISGSTYPVIRVLSTNSQGGDLMLASTVASNLKTWEMLVEGSDLQIWEGQQFNRMTVKSGGLVGISTNNPQGLLQLANSYVVAPAPSNDNTGATDWANITAAIQAVTPNSPTATAGTVYLQAGLYYVNDTITLPGGLVLIGAGYSHSREAMIGTVIRMVFFWQ
jgi:hypothetical protein